MIHTTSSFNRFAAVRTALAAIVAGAALTAPASAAGTSPIGMTMSVKAPVSLQSCRQDVAFIQPTLDGLRLAQASENVSFVNNAAVAATDIDFSVVLNGETQTVRDHGSFAPGVTVDREFTQFAGTTYRTSPADCRVVAVRYADGSSWKLSDGAAVVGVK